MLYTYEFKRIHLQLPWKQMKKTANTKMTNDLNVDLRLVKLFYVF